MFDDSQDGGAGVAFGDRLAVDELDTAHVQAARRLCGDALPPFAATRDTMPARFKDLGDLHGGIVGEHDAHFALGRHQQSRRGKGELEQLETTED